jgi:hypothetical protein
MKSILVFLIVFSTLKTVKCVATNIMIRGPQSSSSAFNQFLTDNKEAKSFQNYFLNNNFSNWNDIKFDGSKESFQSSLSLVNSAFLNSEGKKYLAAILAKNLQIRLDQGQSINDSVELSYRLFFLLNYEPEIRSYYPDIWFHINSINWQKTLKSEALATQVQFKINEFKLRIDLNDAKFFADGIEITEKHLANLYNEDRQWALVSNVYEPIVFYGKWQDFLSQLSHLKALANNSCRENFCQISFDSSESRIANLLASSAAQSPPREESPSFWKKNWPWITAGLVSGFVLANQSRNKIIIERSVSK